MMKHDEDFYFENFKKLDEHEWRILLSYSNNLKPTEKCKMMSRLIDKEFLDKKITFEKYKSFHIVKIKKDLLDIPCIDNLYFEYNKSDISSFRITNRFCIFKHNVKYEYSIITPLIVYLSFGSITFTKMYIPISVPDFLLSRITSKKLSEVYDFNLEVEVEIGEKIYNSIYDYKLQLESKLLELKLMK